MKFGDSSSPPLISEVVLLPRADISAGKRKYLIFMDHSHVMNPGFGNYLVFFPAVYALALLEQREILFFGRSQIMTICKFQATCNFRSAEEVLFPEELDNPTVLKIKDLEDFASGKRSLPDSVYRVVGYMERSTWYTNNSSMVNFIANATSCPYDQTWCMAQTAMKSLFPGFLREELLENIKLLGAGNELKDSISRHPFSAVPKLGITLHFRLQFPSFENSSSPKSVSSRYYSSSFFRQNSTHTLIDNFMEKLFKYDEIKDGVFISSDNFEMKQKLHQLLSARGVPVFIQENGPQQHSKALHSGNLGDNNSLFELFFDWYCLSMGRVTLSWRRVKKWNAMRFLSTFAKSSRMLSCSKAFILRDCTVLDSTDRNWQSF
jgi:hypothetical protein